MHDKNDELSWLWVDDDGDCIDVTEVVRVTPITDDCQFVIVFKNGQKIYAEYRSEEEAVFYRECLLDKMARPYDMSHPNTRDTKVRNAYNKRGTE